MAQTPPSSGTAPSAYFPPPESAGDWRKLTRPDEIRSVGEMDPDKLKAFVSWVLAEYPEPKRNGGVVIRHGWIVAEWYNAATDPHERGGLKSAGKALTVLNMGQVIEDSRAGAFAAHPDPKFRHVDWDSLAYEYIPEGAPLSDPRKARITLRQLAHHVGGIVPEGTPGVTNDPPEGEGFWEFCLGLKPEYASASLYADPGTKFLYATWDIRHLSLIIKSMTGLRTDEFARERLFGPCGMENYNMVNRGGGGADGVIGPASDVRLFTTAREFARIGYLMLRRGVWDGREVLPPALVEEIQRQPFPGIVPDHFRYHWLHKQSTWPDLIPDDMFCTYGAGGNMVVIIPSLDLVFTRVGNSFGIDPNATIHDVTMGVLSAVIPGSTPAR